jgi:hypothetical protein
LGATQSICQGISFGFEIGGGSGPGSGNFSWGGKKKKCRGKKGDEYNDEMGFGFSSALFWGASWSSDDPEKTTFTTGYGAALHFTSMCNYIVREDVIVGNCCD